MKYEVVFRAEARQEAIDAAKYIAERADRDTAFQWYEGLEAALYTLTEMPSHCPFARENDAFPNVELRQLHFQSYRAIFTIVGSVVHVLHVRHYAQQELEEI